MKKQNTDAEVAAMKATADILEPLATPERERVIDWLLGKFGGGKNLARKIDRVDRQLDSIRRTLNKVDNFLEKHE